MADEQFYQANNKFDTTTTTTTTKQSLGKSKHIVVKQNKQTKTTNVR